MEEEKAELSTSLYLKSLENWAHDEPKFSTLEHLRLGIDISVAEHVQKLKLPNGVELSFGEIIALAADFYGVPDKPIIDPTGEDDTASSRRQRFMDAYGTLAHADFNTIKNEVDQIMSVMRKKGLLNELGEVDLNANNMDSTDGSASDKASSDNNLMEEWDKITGGVWIGGVPVLFGRIMKLAECNYDHFLPYAKDAYLVGHELAMEKAKEASRAEGYHEKRQLLQEAYCIDGFACHFLTDCFATGHARTPRYHLEKHVTSSKIGLLLCKYMHDEDNMYGLRVTNKRGDEWIAYGDGLLLTDKARKHYRMTVEAVQTSVNELFNVFQNPEKATSSVAKAVDLIPLIDETGRNNFAMFRMEDGKVVRRQDLENLSDPTTISDWTGLGTLMKLWKYKPSQSMIG